jgi:hypothetical protein
MSSRTRQLAEVDGEGAVWGGAGFAASLVVGVALSPFRRQMGLENVVIVYLAVVAVTAAIGGRAAGLVSALSAALSYNFFFTTPTTPRGSTRPGGPAAPGPRRPHPVRPSAFGGREAGAAGRGHRDRPGPRRADREVLTGAASATAMDEAQASAEDMTCRIGRDSTG